MFQVARKSMSSWLAVLTLVCLSSISSVQAGGIVWHQDLQQSARDAGRQQKPMLVMVGADWCGYCHKMLNETFSNPQMASRINQQFVPVLLDADRQAAAVQQLNVNSFPTVLVINSSNKVLMRIEGYQSTAQLETQLAVFKRPVAPVAPRRWTHTSFWRSHTPLRVDAPLDTLSVAKQFRG